MKTNDSLVRKRWQEWRQSNNKWSHGSFDEVDKFCEYADKLEPEIIKNAVSWKILYYPNKDNFAITQKFESYSRSIFDFLFEANERVMKSIIHANELVTFIEWGYVQIIANYIGIKGKQFHTLPKRDPNTLRKIFEVSGYVTELKKYGIDPKEWWKDHERIEEMLDERKKFKDKIS